MKDDFWDENAACWTRVIESGTIASRAITGPALIEVIRRLRIRSLLDVGCGEGWLARELVPLGVEYFGIDGSPGLVDQARAQGAENFECVRYSALEANQWKPRRRVEAAVFNFSLLAEELSPVLRSVAGLLEHPGTILIQTLHPCFALPSYRDGWQSEDFKSLATAIPFQGAMPWYARTLSSWTRVVRESGLRLEEIHEPSAANAKPASMILILKSRTSSKS